MLLIIIASVIGILILLHAGLDPILHIIEAIKKPVHYSKIQFIKDHLEEIENGYNSLQYLDIKEDKEEIEACTKIIELKKQIINSILEKEL